jgi:hypothetical protein
MPRGKSSALNTNQATAKQWLSNIPDVSKMYEMKSPDELSKIVNDWINGGMQDGDGTYKGGSAPSSTAPDDDDTPAPKSSAKTASNKTYKSIDDAFSDLMED